jgi:hypothetical protein
MTQDFAQRFIHLSLISLTAKTPAELRLNHTERRFNIRSFMVVLIKPILIVRVEVKHAPPQRVFTRLWIRCHSKVNIRHRRVADNQLEIVLAGICLVRRYLTHHEVFSRRIHKRFEARTIASILVRHKTTRHDVGLDPAHQMQLDPALLINHLRLAILGMKPTVITACREARTINGKVRLNRSQRQTAFSDERVKISRQPIGFHVVRQRVEMRRACHVTALLRFSEVRGRATCGKAAIDLEDDCKQHIRESKAGSAVSLFAFLYAIAKRIEQGLKMSLLVRLREIVLVPFLLVSQSLDRLRRSNYLLWMKNQFNGMDMLALLMIGFVVRTRTGLRL